MDKPLGPCGEAILFIIYDYFCDSIALKVHSDRVCYLRYHPYFVEAQQIYSTILQSMAPSSANPVIPMPVPVTIFCVRGMYDWVSVV